jgi:acetylcholinesterase
MGSLHIVQRVITTFTVLTSLSSVTATYSTSEVTLPGYGSFVGTSISQTLTKKPLPETVDAWLGIEYATQPVGEARFAPVGRPEPFSGVKNASQYGFSCHQDPLDISYEMNEACLSMNVYRPQNLSSHAKLPVLIWVHGVRSIIGVRSKLTDSSGWVCCWQRKELRRRFIRIELKRAIDRGIVQL